jgi:hypothetical protein
MTESTPKPERTPRLELNSYHQQLLAEQLEKWNGVLQAISESGNNTAVFQSESRQRPDSLADSSTRVLYHKVVEHKKDDGSTGYTVVYGPAGYNLEHARGRGRTEPMIGLPNGTAIYILEVVDAQRGLLRVEVKGPGMSESGEERLILVNGDSSGTEALKVFWPTVEELVNRVDNTSPKSLWETPLLVVLPNGRTAVFYGYEYEKENPRLISFQAFYYDNPTEAFLVPRDSLWQFVREGTPATLTDLYREHYPFFIEGRHYDPEDPGYSQMMVEYIRQVTGLSDFELSGTSKESGNVTSDLIHFEGYSLNVYFEPRRGASRWVITIGRTTERESTTISGNDLREVWSSVIEMTRSGQGSE